MTDDSNLPNIFFCVALVSWFFFDSFIAEQLFDVGLVFRHKSPFSTIKPVISCFPIVSYQLYSDTDRIFIRDSVEQPF